MRPDDPPPRDALAFVACFVMVVLLGGAAIATGKVVLLVAAMLFGALAQWINHRGGNGAS